MRKFLALLLLFPSFAYPDFPTWLRADFQVESCHEHLSSSMRLAKKRFGPNDGAVPPEMLILELFLPRYSKMLSELNWRSGNRIQVNDQAWTGRISSEDSAHPIRASLNIRSDGSRNTAKIAVSVRRPTSVIGDFSERDFQNALTNRLFEPRELRNLRTSKTIVKRDTVLVTEIDSLPLTETTLLTFQALMRRLGLFE